MKRKTFGLASQSLPDLIEQEQVARMNRDGLTKVMGEFNLQISSRDFDDWRPTLRENGAIPGVVTSVTILATNGLLGWFIRGQDCETASPTLNLANVFYGHIQMFTGKVRPLFSTRKEKKVLEARERAPRRKSRKRLLAEI